MALGTVVEIGWRAAERLAGHATVVRVLAPLRASIYIVVAEGDILWVGGPADPIHPRAILLSEPPDASGLVAGDSLSIPPHAVRAWRPEAPIAPVEAPAAVRRAAERLARTVVEFGDLAGFGAWLMGRPLSFPLTTAAGAADALAAACAADNAATAAEAALALLGLGPGLTPSGDDFVGGAFFARAALAQLGADAGSWRQAATAVGKAARGSTSPISAVLLGDLLEGHGWSPLHELARSLASADDARAVTAARRLTQLGHSSGWDLLAGFIAGTR